MDDGAVKAVSSLIEYAANKPDATGEFEIEARYKPAQALDRAGMNVLLARFESNLAAFDTVTQWVETHDFFFYLHLPKSLGKGGVGKEKTEVRCTSTPDSETLELKVENIVKTRIHSVLLTDGSCNWKLCLSKETKVPSQYIPNEAIHSHQCRIKQRKSFIYASARSGISFRFDFTLVWQGATKAEAETAQRSESAEPLYEFEVEMITTHPDVETEYIAESFLAKLQDFTHCSLTVSHSSSAPMRARPHADRHAREYR